LILQAIHIVPVRNMFQEIRWR